MVKHILLAILVMALCGCGFHLRTYNFGTSVDSFAVTGKQNLEVARQVRQALKQAGVAETPVGQAALVLDIMDQRRERRSISTGGSARAAEYETSIAVQYRIFDQSGGELAPATWVERQRVYRVDVDNIVGSSEEQAILQRELLQDVVGQLVRAMDAVSRSLDTADAG
jgi:LPS-assembly lipoprotein